MLCGYRFPTIFLTNQNKFTSEELNTEILPFMAVNYDPVRRKKETELENQLISMGVIKEENRKKWPDPILIDLNNNE